MCTQTYLRKRAGLAEALRRVQGAGARKEHGPAPGAPAVATPPAGCRPTVVAWGNAKFATAGVGSSASTCRQIRAAAERDPHIAVAPTSEGYTSVVRSW